MRLFNYFLVSLLLTQEEVMCNSSRWQKKTKNKSNLPKTETDESSKQVTIKSKKNNKIWDHTFSETPPLHRCQE